MENKKGKKLIIVGAGLAGCSVAELAQNSFETIILIDDFSKKRMNAFLTNAGSLHDGYGTTGHSHSAMLSVQSPLRDTIRVSFQHSKLCSLFFNPTPGKLFRALSTLYKLYDKKIAQDSAPIFYRLYHRSSQLFKKIAEAEHIFTESGRISLTQTPEYFDKIVESYKKGSQRFSLNGEILSAQQIKEVAPSVKKDVSGGIYYSNDLSFHPPDFSEKWLKRLGKKVQLISGKVRDTEVINKEIKSITLSNSKKIEGDHYFFCTGSFNHPVMNPYTIPGGGISVDIELKEKSYRKLGKPLVYLPEKLLYYFPYENGTKVRLCSGLFLGRSHLNVSQQERAEKSMIKAFLQYQDGIEIKRTERIIFGARPISPDALPIAGKIPYLNNASIVNGLGSYGYPALALVEAIFYPNKEAQHHPNLQQRVDPNRFSPLWTRMARALT